MSEMINTEAKATIAKEVTKPKSSVKTGLSAKDMVMGVGSNIVVVAATNVALLAGSKLVSLAGNGIKKAGQALKSRKEAKKALKAQSQNEVKEQVTEPVKPEVEE